MWRGYASFPNKIKSIDRANGQGIRTILQTFGALATELGTRPNREQSKPRQLHCKPQIRVADPTYSLMQEKNCQYSIDPR